VVAFDAVRSLTYTTSSEMSGQYVIANIPVGTYTVTASANLYNPASFGNVLVASAITTTQGFSLALHQADLAINISNDSGPVNISSALTYTLNITNIGPDPVSSTVTVSNTSSAGTTLNGASGTGWNCATVGLTASCTRPSLAVGSAPPLVVTLTTPAAPGVFTNTAIITSTVYDPVVVNNQAVVTGTIQGNYLPVVTR
jgi:hypothetical protein